MASDKSVWSSHESTRKKTSHKVKKTKDTNVAPRNEETDNEEGGVSLKEGKEDTIDDKKKKQSKKRRLQDGGDEGTAGKEEESRKKKKKRVSFSADAKVQESDSSDSDAGENKRMTEAPVEEDQADDEADTDKKADKRKKKKKEKGKKKKDRNGADVNASTDENAFTTPKIHEPPVLSYLNLYYKHRAAWKFQKNRETHLFKHIMSLEQVPVQYNAALLSYLQGLKSEAAKQRLREGAEAAVKTDIEDTQTDGNVEDSENQSASAMENYRRAVGAFRTNLSESKLDEEDEYSQKLDADLTKRFEQRQRGEVVLFALDGTLYTFVKPVQKGKKNAQAQPGKKKKKNRTAVVEISSSSESESSSNSSSGGDSDSDSDSSSS